MATIFNFDAAQLNPAQAQTISDNRGDGFNVLGVVKGDAPNTLIKVVGANHLIFADKPKCSKFHSDHGHAQMAVDLSGVDYSRIIEQPYTDSIDGMNKVAVILAFASEEDTINACIVAKAGKVFKDKNVYTKEGLEALYNDKDSIAYIERNGQASVYTPEHKQLLGSKTSKVSRKVNMAGNVNTLAKHFNMTAEQIAAPYQVFDLQLIPGYRVNGVEYLAYAISYNATKSASVAGKVVEEEEAEELLINADTSDTSDFTNEESESNDIRQIDLD